MAELAAILRAGLVPGDVGAAVGANVSRQPDTSPLWDKLAALKVAHSELLKRIESRYHGFSGLECR